MFARLYDKFYEWCLAEYDVGYLTYHGYFGPDAKIPLKSRFAGYMFLWRIV